MTTILSGPLSFLPRLLHNRLRFPRARIYSPSVGRHVRIGVGCTIGRNVEIGEGVEIGDWSYVNSGTLVGSGIIGRYCSVSYDCQIGLGQHPVDWLSTSPRVYRLIPGLEEWDDYASPPRIGNDVWIGGNAIVLQSVVIGDGAIIAAGAVVTKDVPPYAIVGGVPAKIIRYRFSALRIEQLLRERWWDMSRGDLSDYLRNHGVRFT